MNYLIDIYKSFTFESNKWIRLSTIQIIGRFVSNYTENNLNNYILEYYIDLVDEFYNNPSSEMVELDVNKMLKSSLFFILHIISLLY